MVAVRQPPYLRRHGCRRFTLLNINPIRRINLGDLSLRMALAVPRRNAVIGRRRAACC